MRTLLIAAVFVAGVAPSSAQSTGLAGIVLDARTGAPLSGVVVATDDQSTTTNADGRFYLDLPPGQHIISASLIGFALFRQTIQISTDRPDDITIRLSEGAGAFEEHVTVTAAAGPVADTTAADRTSLRGRDLEALRGVTLDDPLRALHALPSVAATDDFYSEFAVRGNPFRHINLLVDGMPSPYLMHSVFGVSDGGSIAMINSDAIGSMSLQPGSYPQHVGRRLGAQAGIDMREGNRGRRQMRVGLSGTSATVLAEGPFSSGRGSWLFSARRSYLDLLLNRIGEGGNLAFGFTDGEAKVVFDVTPTQQLQLLTIAGTSQFNEKPDNLGANDEATIRGHSWLAGLTWRLTPSVRYTVTQRIYLTGLVYKNRNREQAVLDESQSTELAWRGDAAVSLGHGVLLEIGGDVQRLAGAHTRRRALNDTADLTIVGDYDTRGHAASAYADVVAHPIGRLSMSAGARLDRWSLTNDSMASPWASVDVGLTGTLSARIGSGVYRQFADFEQIAGVRGGGPELQPESATHLDVGLSQKLPHSITAQATWFNRDERNVLWADGAEPRRLADGSILPGRGDAQWTNALSGQARGLELVVRRDAPTGLSGWIGYAYARHQYTNTATGETFWSDFDQRHALSLFGRYAFSNRMTFGAKFRYGSNYPLVGYLGHPTTSPTEPPLFGGERSLFYTLAESRNTLRLPEYARLDVRADRTFTWSKRRVTVFAEVANALNHRNERNVPYSVDRSGRVFGPTDSLLPILPSAGFVIEF